MKPCKRFVFSFRRLGNSKTQRVILQHLKAFLNIERYAHAAAVKLGSVLELFMCTGELPSIRRPLAGLTQTITTG